MDLSREEEDQSCLFAMHMASASVLPMVLKSAIELDLLELIKKAGPGAMVSPTELAAQLPISNPEAPTMLDRILRLLAIHSILKCEVGRLNSGAVVERRYGVAPLCEYLTDNADGVSMAALLLMTQDKVFVQTAVAEHWGDNGVPGPGQLFFYH